MRKVGHVYPPRTTRMAWPAGSLPPATVARLMPPPMAPPALGSAEANLEALDLRGWTFSRSAGDAQVVQVHESRDHARGVEARNVLLEGAKLSATEVGQTS